MPAIRFVEGTSSDFSAIYNCDWPLLPEVGSFLSARLPSGAIMDWEIYRLCHVMGDDLGLDYTLAWIRAAGASARAQDDDWVSSFDRADNDDPFDVAETGLRYSTPTD